MSGSAFTVCTTHLKERAAWRCTSCEKRLCLDCAAAKSIQPSGEVIVCLHCNNMAMPLTVPRKIDPWWIALGPFVRHLFTMGGVTQMLAVAIVVTVFSLLSRTLGYVILVSYVFQVIRSVSYGADKLPEPADFVGLSDVVLPVLRLWVALSFLWVPALVYIIYGIGLRELFWDPTLLNDPVLYLIMLFGALYVPAALITAAVAESVIAVLNPLITVRLIARIPGQYLATTAVLAGLAIANFLVEMIVGLLVGRILIIGTLVTTYAGLYIPLVGAFILGRLIYQNAEEFGVLGVRDREVPEWPNARPRGSLQHAVPVAAQQPIEVPEVAGDLEDSLRRGDDRAALEAFREQIVGGVYPELEPRWELRLATILERAGEAVEAARACERAARSDLQGPLAPRAIFTAARILIERAGQPVEGVKLYEYLIAHYPNDDYAARAEAALKRI